MNEMKQKYIAPEVLDDLILEMEGMILTSSSMEEIDPNFESVETMGQEIGGTIGDNDWSHEWK